MDMDIYKKFQNGVPVSLRDFKNIDLAEENLLNHLSNLEKSFKKVKRDKLSLYKNLRKAGRRINILV